MKRWLARKYIPYEGLWESCPMTTEEILTYLKAQSGLDRDDIEIIPDPESGYSPWEFEEKYGVPNL